MQRVDPVAADHIVIARASMNGIVTVASKDDIASAPRRDRFVAVIDRWRQRGTGRQTVGEGNGSVIAKDVVVTVTSGDRIALSTSNDHIDPITSGDRVQSGCAGRFTCRQRCQRSKLIDRTSITQDNVSTSCTSRTDINRVIAIAAND